MNDQERPYKDRAALVERFIDQMNTVRDTDRILGITYVAVMATMTIMHLILRVNNLMFIAPTLAITFGIGFRQAVISKVIYDAEKLYQEVSLPFNRYSKNPSLSEANANRYHYLEDFYSKKLKGVTELWMLDSLFRRWKKVERTLAKNQPRMVK